MPDLARCYFGDDEVAVLQRPAEHGARVALGCDVRSFPGPGSSSHRRVNGPGSRPSGHAPRNPAGAALAARIAVELLASPAVAPGGSRWGSSLEWQGRPRGRATPQPREGDRRAAGAHCRCSSTVSADARYLRGEEVPVPLRAPAPLTRADGTAPRRDLLALCTAGEGPGSRPRCSCCVLLGEDRVPPAAGGRFDHASEAAKSTHA